VAAAAKWPLDLRFDEIEGEGSGPSLDSRLEPSPGPSTLARSEQAEMVGLAL